MPYASAEIKAEHQRATQKGYRSRREARADSVKNVAVPVPVWEEMKRAYRTGHSTLTAFLMGDPLLGRSALDKGTDRHASA